MGPEWHVRWLVRGSNRCASSYMLRLLSDSSTVVNAQCAHDRIFFRSLEWYRIYLLGLRHYILLRQPSYRRLARSSSPLIKVATLNAAALTSPLPHLRHISPAIRPINRQSIRQPSGVGRKVDTSHTEGMGHLDSADMGTMESRVEEFSPTNAVLLLSVLLRRYLI